MDKLPVGQLPDLQQSNNDDEIMVITNSEYSQLKKEKISDLITDFTSTNENNALTKGTDGKMFVTDFGNASNITEGTLPVSVLPDIPKDKLPDIEITDLPESGVTADTYAYPSSVTVNAQGMVTAISEGTPSGANANTDLSNITEAGKEVIRQNSGAGMPVGTIFAHTCAADFVPENSLPCNGTEYTQTQFPTFYTQWLVGGKLNTCTYEEYQTEITTYGKCAKFGLDTANSKFKVPTIPDGTHIQQAMTDDELGKSYNAGLPNITGKILCESGNFGLYTIGDGEGALKAEGTGTRGFTGSSTGSFSSGLILDASLSNSIYGNSETIQPNAIALRYFVVVATGSINQSEMNWSEWASNLEGKANNDLSNCTKPYILEMYNNDTSGYMIYSNGFCEQWGTTAPITGNTNVIMLLKEYTNTNYNVYLTSKGAVATQHSLSGMPITTNTFNIGIFTDTTAVCWRTIGYIS